MVALFDAHTHLNDENLFKDWQHYLQQFFDRGGKGLVNVGASEMFNNNAIVIAKKYKNMQNTNFVKSSIGFHPHEAVMGMITDDTIDKKISLLKKQYQDNKEYIVAIGESGLDYHYEDVSKTITIQKKLFSKQCILAQELQLPLIIHSRDAFEDTFEIIKDFSDLKIYFHCRGYDREQIELLQNTFSNLRIGFCGNTSYKKADNLRASLKICKPNQLLIETDAPYLSPQIVRGTINHPANVYYIYEFVAEYLNISLEDLAEQVEKNFFALYKK